MGIDKDLVLAIVPKVGSSISIPCSIFIIYETIGDHLKGKGTPIQRALMGMCLVDICASFAWFLSTWAVPEGTAPLARGNMASCNFQGFLLQLAVGAPLYNCSLALYYLLVIRYNWTNLQLHAIEKYVHGFILAFTIGTSIAGLPLTMYNPIGTVCWVIGAPIDCENSSASPSDIPCERGNWAWVFGIALFYGPLWLCVLMTIVAMTMIYVQVRRTFRRNEQYSFRRNRDRSSSAASAPKAKRKTSTSTSAVATESKEQQRKTEAKMLDPAGRIMSCISRCSVFRKNGDERLDKTAIEKELEDYPGDKVKADEETNAAVQQTEDGARDEPKKLMRNDSFEVHPDTTSSSTTRVDASFHPQFRRYESPNLSTTEVSGGIGFKRAVGGESIREEWREWKKRAGKRNKQSAFATQAILYSLSFFVTWMPSTVWSVASWFGMAGFGFDLAAGTCEPLQGFWNMLIFIRSRPQSQEKLKKVFEGCCCYLFDILPSPLQNTSSQGRSSAQRSSANSSSATDLNIKSGSLTDSSRRRTSFVNLTSKDGGVESNMDYISEGSRGEEGDEEGDETLKSQQFSAKEQSAEEAA